MTPLMWSCYNKNESIARRLIELGADVHEKDVDGRTAAHWYTHTHCIIKILFIHNKYIYMYSHLAKRDKWVHVVNV